MSTSTLHIVSFNIPYPPDYGGVIDVYYKIKALHEIGVKVILHCFKYGREESKELDEICEAVYYYPRKKRINTLVGRLPYIVASRQSELMLERLVADEHPVLFEGLHSTFYLDHPKLKDKKKAVRMHNVEWEYYEQLSKSENNPIEKLYLQRESKRLKDYENKLQNADLILAISPKDEVYLKQHYGRVEYIPAFHGNEEITATPGRGDYCLYHGNLSVPENEQAALYLINEIFNNLNISLKIAGQNPSKSLQKEALRYSNIEIIANPDENEMNKLAANAHIHVLPTFQDTGIKLKLINALFTGRYCLVNPQMVEQTGLEELCIIADSPEEMRARVQELMEQDFSESELAKRRKLLNSIFSNQTNAQKLKELIF